MSMTVQEWRDAVEARVRRQGELVAERRAVAADSVEGRKLKDEARTNNRLLKDNRRHLAIAEGVAARKVGDGHTPESRIAANTAAELERGGGMTTVELREAMDNAHTEAQDAVRLLNDALNAKKVEAASDLEEAEKALTESLRLTVAAREGLTQ